MLLDACAGTIRTSLPTHIDWNGAGPAALQDGQLVLAGDCLNLVDPPTGATWLVIWQPGTVRSGPNVLDESGTVIATVGDAVGLGGGEYDGTTVQSELASAIPAPCRTGRYWLVGDVRWSPAPSPS
ncbi:MAG TPA: hypothetical protein VGI98_06150 [Candidatus Limnocylindrales bacterium]